MASTLNISTSYAGEKAAEFISAALLSANTIEQGGITVKPNIKFKQVIQRIETSGLLQDGTCDFTATGTVDKTERIIEPKTLQVNVQLCKEEFRSDWDAISMGLSAHDNLPKTVQDYLIGLMAAKVAAANETSIWSGTDTAGSFAGFETLLAADADLPAANEITGTTVTAANVIDELGKIIDAVPSALYSKDDLYVYVSQNIYRSYVRALGGFGTAGIGANGYRGEGNNQSMGDLVFDGVKLFVANGMSDNTAVCAQKSNLFFGTGLLNDSNIVKVLDMSDLDGSDNVRFIMKMTASVQYGVAADIVTYGIVNGAN